MQQQSIIISTAGRGTYNITNEIAAIVAKANRDAGICNLFIKHTSASLIVCEDADPTVRADLERFMARLVVDGDNLFEHNTEGEDDMPAHIRSLLTQTSISIPIVSGRLALGTWQGLFIYEHRKQSHQREIVVTVL